MFKLVMSSATEKVINIILKRKKKDSYLKTILFYK